MKTFEEWTSALDNGFGVDVIYLDYSKAFDSVPHQRLVAKLEAYGIRGGLHIYLNVKFSFKQIPKGGVEQPVVQVGSSMEWCSTGICLGTPSAYPLR